MKWCVPLLLSSFVWCNKSLTEVNNQSNSFPLSPFVIQIWTECSQSFNAGGLGHGSSIEEAFSSLEAYFWGVSFKSKHFFTSSNGLSEVSFTSKVNGIKPIFDQQGYRLNLGWNIFLKIMMWKMSIQYSVLDSSPPPLEHESSPVTIKPGLPPNLMIMIAHI